MRSKTDPRATTVVPKKNDNSYAAIESIDGSHPLQSAVTDAYVSYRVRYRPGGKIAYFNFELAKTMGLIEKDHENRLNHDLTRTLLDTFALQIINEYDIEHGFPKTKIKANSYMATRYLQIQHRCKLGSTSGDGRSIWNGFVNYNGTVWDVSSCGTGATCLSPASANNNRNYKSGDTNISYGCGYSLVSEGFIDALLSRVLNENNIQTEQILCVLEFSKGMGITVRVGRNLLRPSHFFNHLKQSNLQSLKAMVDYYIKRETCNGRWPNHKGKSKYRAFAESMAETFGRIASQFESFYIFCWLEWDGDNILANGEIIDFGSVRQFGLFYGNYRFDDDERWSTTIKEQKSKARYIVHCFVQIYEFIKSGQRPSLASLKDHSILKIFDDSYEKHKRRFLLWRCGFNQSQIDQLVRFNASSVDYLGELFEALELAEDKFEQVRVPDGKLKVPLTNMRKFLLELPEILMGDQMTSSHLMLILCSQEGLDRGYHDNYRARKLMKRFVKVYRELYRKIACARGFSEADILVSLLQRSLKINRPDRITGNGVCLVTDELMRYRNKLSPEEMSELIEFIGCHQQMDPDRSVISDMSETLNEKQLKIAKDITRLIWLHRESI